MDTFVVRLWSPGTRDDGLESVTGLHGTAHHVGSGHSAPFRSGGQLLDLLTVLRASDDDTGDDTGDDTHHSLDETLKEHSA